LPSLARKREVDGEGPGMISSDLFLLILLALSHAGAACWRVCAQDSLNSAPALPRTGCRTKLVQSSAGRAECASQACGRGQDCKEEDGASAYMISRLVSFPQRKYLMGKRRNHPRGRCQKRSWQSRVSWLCHFTSPAGGVSHASRETSAEVALDLVEVERLFCPNNASSPPPVDRK